jgi:hypothetical protein
MKDVGDIMDNFLNRFGNLIKGAITGFDRIIFKGILKPLMYEGGMKSFLYNNNVLNKNYKEFMIDKSKFISAQANNYTYKQIGCKTIYIPSCNTRKEELVHEKQKELGITKGLIGTWSCVESCCTYKGTFDEIQGFPKLSKHFSRCKYIYFYFDHPDYGFMSVRIQTWSPYNIQIALNGREWLRRTLEKNNISHKREKNKFLYIENYDIAQQFLNEQLNTDWVSLFDSFVPIVFPNMKDFLGDMSYYWTLDQSEWARDYIFDSPDSLKPIIQDLLHFSFVSDSVQNIFKYMNRTSDKSDFSSRINKFDNGYCFKTYLNKNSAKFYSYIYGLRFEFTINNPEVFKVYRFKSNSSDNNKYNLPLVKGVSFTSLRAQVSENHLNRFINHVSSAHERKPVDDIFSTVSNYIIKNGKRYRGLDILGKDKSLLKAVSDISFNVDYISNKQIQKSLANSDWAKGMKGKKLSSRITRQLRILREHGIIKKVSNRNKYFLTDKGRKLTSSLNILLGTSSDDLLKLAA